MSKLFILLFLMTSTVSSKEIPLWVQKIRLSYQEGTEASGQRALGQIIDVKKMVVKELNPESEYLREATTAVVILQAVDQIPALINIMRSNRVDQMEKVNASTAINHLVSNEQLPIVLSAYEKICPFTAKTPAALKISCLHLFEKFPHKLKREDLLALLDDPSYEVRLEAVNKAHLMKDTNDQVSVLRKSLVSRPYQLRLSSLEIVKHLPLKVKDALKTELELCKNDTHAEVKKLCREM